MSVSTQVKVTKLVEGLSNLVVRVDLLSDGSGDLVNQVLVQPSDCNPSLPNNNLMFRVRKIWYGFVWFDAVLGMNLLQPQNIWTLPRDCDFTLDFTSIDGLADYQTVPPANKDGSVWLTTNGFTTAGMVGTMVLELRKSR